MFLSDLHIHTTLSSCCNDDLAIPSNYIKKAKELNLKVIGFANHLWESEKIKGYSDWYFTQNFEHINKIKSQLNLQLLNTSDIKILIGAETELFGDILGITKESALKLDYIFCPHSHFHMSGYTIPEEIVSCEKIAKYLIKTFKKACEFDFLTAIVHPFDPIIKNMGDELLNIYSYISDLEFYECFTLAKNNNIGIEINMASFLKNPKDITNKTYFRMIALAKEAGCKFVFGSDTHTLENLSNIVFAKQIIEDLKLTNDNLIDIIKN